MPQLVQVRFCDKAYPVACRPGEIELRRNDFVVVRMPDGASQTGYVQGFEFRCVHQAENTDIPAIERLATSDEVREWHFLKRREAEALTACKALAEKHKLEMKISAVHFDPRTHKVVFYFTAEKRVDFREMVKDLAAQFHARIELWQIGVRDETRRLGGMGVCGRELCCVSWIREFAPVSIRYAKTQDIQFSPAKLSGSCGRLRCCLAFEQQQYLEMGRDVPNIGNRVKIQRYGEVKIVDRNLLTQNFTITDAEGQMHVVPFGEVEGLEHYAEQPDETPRTEKPAPRPDRQAAESLEDNYVRRVPPAVLEPDETDEQIPPDDEPADEQAPKPASRRSRRRRATRGKGRGREKGEQPPRATEKREAAASDADAASEARAGGKPRRRGGARRRGSGRREADGPARGGAAPDRGGSETIVRPDKSAARSDGDAQGKKRPRGGRPRRGRRPSDKPDAQT